MVIFPHEYIEMQFRICYIFGMSMMYKNIIKCVLDIILCPSFFAFANSNNYFVDSIRFFYG